MFDAKTISQVIGRPTFESINASNLPKIETMTLLQIWADGSRQKLRDLAKTDDLIQLLKLQYRPALEQASQVRLHNMHLTVAECLQAADLPLTL